MTILSDKEKGGILFLIAMHLIIYPLLITAGLTFINAILGESVVWGVFLMLTSIVVITDKEYTAMKSHIATYEHFTNLKEKVLTWIDEYNKEKTTNAETT